MRSASLFLLLAPAAVSASPAIDLKTLFCKLNNGVIKVLDKDASATKYCSSYLAIPTATISKTVTETPSSVYSTRPVTVTGEATTTTETETEYSTSYETITSTDLRTAYATITTTSTSTLGCLTSAYTYTAPTGIIPNNNVIRDRHVELKKPKCIPSNWPKAYVSSACKCLSIPTPSTTTTFTQTLPTGTITVESTVIETPTATASTTTTEVRVETVYTTTTKVTTSIRTAYATETKVTTGTGISYRKYEHTFNAGLENSGFTADFFKNKSPDFSGRINSLSFPGVLTRQMTLPGNPEFDSAFSAVLIQGFFVAKQAGTYTFSCSVNTIDNWGYLWTGSSALNWNNDNTGFKGSRTGPGPDYGGDVSLQVTLGKGDAVPITYLWANGGNRGRSLISIRAPNGLDITNDQDLFAPACAGTF